MMIPGRKITGWGDPLMASSWSAALRGRLARQHVGALRGHLVRRIRYPFQRRLDGQAGCREPGGDQRHGVQVKVEIDRNSQELVGVAHLVAGVEGDQQGTARPDGAKELAEHSLE